MYKNNKTYSFHSIGLGLSKVHVCGPGSRTTRDVDDERVRVYVDENNKVTSQPTIGWFVLLSCINITFSNKLIYMYNGLDHLEKDWSQFW